MSTIREDIVNAITKDLENMELLSLKKAPIMDRVRRARTEHGFPLDKDVMTQIVMPMGATEEEV